MVVSLTVVVAAVIFALADQNRQLKSALARGPSPSVSLAPGDRIPDVGLVDLSGEEAMLHGLLDAGGVVAFLTTSCKWCERSLDHWDLLAEGLRAEGIAFSGISLDPLHASQRYADEHSIQWPLWVLGDQEDRAKIDIASVPQTILIGEGGIVVRIWRGALMVPDLTAITGEAIHKLGARPAAWIPAPPFPGGCRGLIRCESSRTRRADVSAGFRHWFFSPAVLQQLTQTRRKEALGIPYEAVLKDA
jgi:peroxiredoxin